MPDDCGDPIDAKRNSQEASAHKPADVGISGVVHEPTQRLQLDNAMSQKIQARFKAGRQYRAIKANADIRSVEIAARSEVIEAESQRRQAKLRAALNELNGRKPNAEEKVAGRALVRAVKEAEAWKANLAIEKQELKEQVDEAKERWHKCVEDAEEIEKRVFCAAGYLPPQKDGTGSMCSRADPAAPHERGSYTGSAAAAVELLLPTPARKVASSESSNQVRLGTQVRAARLTLQLAYARQEIYRVDYDGAFAKYSAAQTNRAHTDLREEFGRIWFEKGREITRYIARAEEILEEALLEAAEADVAVPSPDDDGTPNMPYDDEYLAEVLIRNVDWSRVEAWIRNVDGGAMPDSEPAGVQNIAARRQDVHVTGVGNSVTAEKTWMSQYVGAGQELPRVQK
jgi:hypothetical protein